MQLPHLHSPPAQPGEGRGKYGSISVTINIYANEGNFKKYKHVGGRKQIPSICYHLESIAIKWIWVLSSNPCELHIFLTYYNHILDTELLIAVIKSLFLLHGDEGSCLLHIQYRKRIKNKKDSFPVSYHIWLISVKLWASVLIASFLCTSKYKSKFFLKKAYLTFKHTQ